MHRMICIISFLAGLTGQNMSVVNGHVKSESGESLAYVNVYFLDNLEGVMTNQEGRFSIVTSKMGKRVLRISHIGYEQQDLLVNVSATAPDMIKVILKKLFIKMDQITVSAGSFTMADEEGQTLTSLDVVTTAGAAADIFRAIQTLPGVNQVDEGAGMYVRGGDVSETMVILDQATISHPYKYESDTGGYFGMINPFLLSGTYFSTGGFSAKYGNVLSGVLAMESLDLPSRSSVEFGAGLAALSLGGAWLVVPNKLGLRFSGNYSDTKYLFKVNGGENRFQKVPLSWDGNFSAIWKYSSRGQIKFFHYSNVDEISAKYDSPTYSGYFTSKNINHFSNLQLHQLIGQNMLLKSSLSFNEFTQFLQLGAFQNDLDDKLLKWRTDISIPITEKLEFNSGLIMDRIKTALTGQYPENWNDLNLDSSTTIPINIDYATNHTGFYIETEIAWTQRLFTTTGLRTDILEKPRQSVLDPRFSLNYRLSDTQFLKLATGHYHQYPQARYRDEREGNPDLQAMQAVHNILGYEYKAEITNLKVEVYHKKYDHLVLVDTVNNNTNDEYTNDGYGYAYGADIFLKSTFPIISGWITYSFLDSKRQEFDYLKLVPTDYDINHNLTAALKMRIGALNNISLTYRHTTGKPYTPTENKWNAARLPSMQRLDISFSRLYSIGKNGLLVVSISISNVLDRQNLYGYIYSPDYKDRTELKSIHGRNVYFGFSVIL